MLKFETKKKYLNRKVQSKITFKMWIKHRSKYIKEIDGTNSMQKHMHIRI